MANYLASSEFTFVHPSSGLLSGTPATTVAYNLDYHSSQNIFSPINCTLPTTIQFPTPSVTSLPLVSCVQTGFGLPEATVNAPWQPPYVASNTGLPSSLSAWPDGFRSSALTLSASTQLPKISTAEFETSNMWCEKFCDDVRPVIRCKRKAVGLPEDCIDIPAKIHVNEERMSACMNDLHLDNNNIGAQPDLENETWFSQEIKTDSSMNELESLDLEPSSSSCSVEANSKLGLINKDSRIELCRELELGLQTKEILPKIILDEVAKSSMQLVLWTPNFILNSLSNDGDGSTSVEPNGKASTEAEMASDGMSSVKLEISSAAENDLMAASTLWSTKLLDVMTAVPTDLSSAHPDDCEDMDL